MFYLIVLEWIQPVMVEKAWGQKLEASLSILGTEITCHPHTGSPQRAQEVEQANLSNPKAYL